MAKLGFTAVVFLLVTISFAFASDSPELSPAPAPESGDTPSPEELPPSSGITSPAAFPPVVDSPPFPVAPSPSDLPLEGSPTNSPSPAPSFVSDTNQGNDPDGENEVSGGGSGGMGGGKKAGIVVGVVVGACLVGLGGMVYKKRQENIRRSQYGYSARTELL